LTVPWPDFSELSFGFSFLREFERLYAPSGKFPSAPDFISQPDEASLGYDVEAALNNSTPVFFQFRRSFVLTTHRANEIQNGDFLHPVLFRMHLRKKEKYRQHKALCLLEQRGNTVLYVTSQIGNFDELTRAYVSQTVVDSVIPQPCFLHPRLSCLMISTTTIYASVQLTNTLTSTPKKAGGFRGRIRLLEQL
jgi:hypothetical protein